jgi:SAM-dependent methyltransferase
MVDFISQKNLFVNTEGDQWYARNKQSYSSSDQDLVIDTLRSIELIPKKVLEIGCSNGNRLASIKSAFNAETCGIDPSAKAVREGNIQFPDVGIQVGTADSLPFQNGAFDTIIFGFCLYLCDRHDLFKIAYEADRCLQDLGTLVIKDFLPPFPFKNKYSHHSGAYSYKMDYSKMFSWNPCYTEVARVVTSHTGYQLRDYPNERVGVTVIRKNFSSAYPDEPFK